MPDHIGLFPFLVSVLCYVTIIPAILLLILINELYRLLLSIYLYFKHNGEVSLVSVGNDAIWLTDRKDKPTMVTFGCRFKGKVSKDSLLNIYHNKIRTDLGPDGTYLYEKSELILTSEHGYACWKKDPNFNLENHIRILDVDDSKPWTKPDIQNLIQQLSQGMDPSKPQWEMIIIPNYKESDESKDEEPTGWMLARFNHSYMDGISVLLFVTRYIAKDCTFFVDPLNFQIPGWKRALFYLSAVIFAPYTVLAVLINSFKTYWPVRESKDGGTGVKRHFRWTEDIDLEYIRGIRKNVAKGTISGVVQNAFISAAMEVLPKERLPEEWVVGELVAMLPYPEGKPQNRFTGFPFTIDCQNEDIGSRLIKSRKAAWNAVTGPYLPLLYFQFWVFGRFPVFTHKWLLESSCATMMFSNVPTSKTPMRYAEGDAEMLEVIAFPPQPNSTGITLFSAAYKNGVKIGASAQSNWLGKEELEEIVERMPRIIKDWAKMGEENGKHNSKEVRHGS